MRGLLTGRQSQLEHPSNRLYRGEVHHFREAAQAFIAALSYEHDLFTDDDEFNRESKAYFVGAIQEARAALAEYEATIGEAERALFARWAASPADTTKQLGDAGLSGDYSTLAL